MHLDRVCEALPSVEFLPFLGPMRQPIRELQKNAAQQPFALVKVSFIPPALSVGLCVRARDHVASTRCRLFSADCSVAW